MVNTSKYALRSSTRPVLIEPRNVPVSPPVLYQVQFLAGLGHIGADVPLDRTARQRILQRRDHNSGLRWIWASDGEVPPNAVKTGEGCYLGRAFHVGSVTPGRVDPEKKACCIPWGGDEHLKKVYEVLCTEGEFVRVTPDSTEGLLRATTAGISEQGEPLFIGRVWCDGGWVSGKVQRSHGVCYIGYRGKEMAYPEYEVFVGVGEPLQDEHFWVNNVLSMPQDASEFESCHVGRARHRNSLLPGTVDLVKLQCHVTWGSEAHSKSRFQYLYNCRGKFVPTKDDHIPVGAVQGGFSDFGEPLFIGRVQVGMKMLVGKVQPSHKVCYVPMFGGELKYSEYEILVLDL